MTIFKQKATATAAAGFLVVSLAACGGGEPQPVAANGGNGAAAADVSLSALQDEANLAAVAEAKMSAAVTALTPGNRYTVVAFANRPGTACTPLVLDLQDASSGKEAEQRQQMLAELPQAWAQYQECMTSRFGSDGEGGSFIFGAIPTTLVAAQTDRYPISTLDIISDGCAVGEGIRTCSPRMLETGFAQEVIDALPARLTPDLSGIQITVSGLGVGTHLNADQIGVLREIWTLYAAKTNASVRFD